MNEKQLLEYLRSVAPDKTKSDSDLIKAYQTGLNTKGAKLKVDGIIGKHTLNAHTQYDKPSNNSDEKTPRINENPIPDKTVIVPKVEPKVEVKPETKSGLGPILQTDENGKSYHTEKNDKGESFKVYQEEPTLTAEEQRLKDRALGKFTEDNTNPQPEIKVEPDKTEPTKTTNSLDDYQVVEDDPIRR
jgi:hypothetical protein